MAVRDGETGGTSKGCNGQLLEWVWCVCGCVGEG